MEIDFLGIYSKHSNYERKSFDSKDLENGEDDVSLSLCTRSRFDNGSKEFPHFSQRETRKVPFVKMISSSNLSSNNISERDHQACPSLIGRPVLHPDCFLNNQNQKLTIQRSKFEFQLQSASPTISTPVARHSHKDISSEKADHRAYMTGNNVPPGRIQNPTRGSRLTVAMARRATLARFLEKRSHRLMQTRSCIAMGTLEVPSMSNGLSNKNVKYSSLSL